MAFELGSVPEWISAAATVVGVGFAYYGFQVWKHEMKGRRKYEHALKLLTIIDATFQAILNLRDADERADSPYKPEQAEQRLRELHAELVTSSFEANIHWPEWHEQMRPFLYCITDTWTKKTTPMAPNFEDAFSMKAAAAMERAKAFLIPIVTK